MCFNPYSFGSHSGRISPTISILAARIVSILIHSEVIREACAPAFSFAFQHVSILIHSEVIREVRNLTICPNPRRRVSILIHSEVIREALASSLLNSLQDLFQSLFIRKSFGKQMRLPACCILVLRFNPYSFGSHSGSRCVYLHAVFWCCVSILIHSEVIREVVNVIRRLRESLLFQSLFIRKSFGKIKILTNC